MLKRTFNGKYKEKKQIDKTKLSKILKYFAYFIVLFLVFFCTYKFITNRNKTVAELYKEQNYEKIVELYDKNSSLLTNTEEERLLIAKSLSYVHRYDDSINLYKDILTAYKMEGIQKTRILAEYVEPLIKSGKTKEAFEVLDVAIPWAEPDLKLLKNLKRIYGLLVASSPTDENLQIGINHLYDYINMDLDKKDWEANYYLALLLYYAGNYDNAITYAINCIVINKDADKAKHLIPKIYYEASEYDKAIEALKSLNKVEINNIDNYLLMGRCYEILRDWQNVVLTYNKVLEFDPENESAHMGLVRCYTMQHDTTALTVELYKIKDLDFSDENKKIIETLLKQIVPTVITSPGQLDLEKVK